MMRSPLLFLLAVFLLAGCGGSGAPFEPPSPPRAGFAPAAGEIRLSPRDAVAFRATTPSGGELVAEWVRDGELVAISSRYEPGYLPAGSFALFASATFAERPLSAGWQVIVDPAIEPVPVPPAVIARPAAEGELEVVVEPAAGLPGGSSYELFYARGNFGLAELPATPSILVEDDGGTGATVLLDGLVPGALYQLRARSVLPGGTMGHPSGATEASAGIEPTPGLGVVARAGQAPGELLVEWSTIDDGSAAAYIVAWSREPVTATAWPHVEKIEQAHVPGEASASLRVEGLLPATLYWVALRVVDAGGGVSRPTETVAGVAAAGAGGDDYLLEGRITTLSSRESGLFPVADASLPLHLASGGTVVVTTMSDGRFRHRAPEPLLLPDPVHLAGYYPSRWRLATEEGIEAVLLRVDTIDPALAYPPDNPDFLNFYQHCLAAWGDTRRYRWDDWPIAVQLFDYTYNGSTGEIVDYRVSMETAIAAWNDGLGHEVFVPVESAPERGVVWSVDQPLNSPNLAETTFEDPPLLWFDEAAPHRIRIRYKPLNFQALVDRIALHELGHVLGLGHAPPVGLVMSVGAPGSVLHPDELRVAALLQQLPQGFRAGRWAP